MPWASFPMMLAVAGATSRARMSVASATCSMVAFAPGANWSVTTGRRVMASNVSGPTKRRALAVMATTTSCPASCSRRTISTAL